MLQVGNFGIKVLSWILEDYKIDTLTEKAKNIVTSLNSS